jgi:hypothetical protein
MVQDGGNPKLMGEERMGQSLAEAVMGEWKGPEERHLPYVHCRAEHFSDGSLNPHPAASCAYIPVTSETWRS